MKAKITWTHAIIVGAIAGLIGCAGTNPTTTGTSVQPLPRFQGVVDDQLPPPAVTTGRTVQASLDSLDVDTFDGILEQLPDRIAIADANKYLVSIDASQVTTGKTYGVLARGGGGHGGHGGGGHGGGGRGHGGRGNFHGHGHFNNGFYNYGGYGSFAYYPYYNYYFPYYAYGSYYYPYAYGGGLPFLYGAGYNSLLSPYTYTGYAGALPWAGTTPAGAGVAAGVASGVQQGVSNVVQQRIQDRFGGGMTQPTQQAPAPVASPTPMTESVQPPQQVGM